MSTVNTSDMPYRLEPRELPGRLTGLLQGRCGLILLGALALGLGAAFNWSWLVAAGVGPRLLSAFPCVAMCALGLCMSRMNSSSEGQSITLSVLRRGSDRWWSGWRFVRLAAAPDQPEDSTRKIAEAYDLKFTQGDDGMQMHGIVTHVIDQDGRLRARFHGLQFEPVNLVIFVNALTNRTQKPHGHPESGFWGKLKGLFL